MSQPIDEQRQEMMAYHLQLPRPQDLPDLPEDDPLAREWRTYKREVVRLLAEGEVGRHALVKGDAVVSIWDTRRDAIQAGRERFGLEVFMVHEIQPVERPIRIGPYFRCLS
jgi:hypothetical protein